MSRVGSTSDLFALGVGIVNDPVTHYFENFQVLAENQMWLEIIHQGEQALRNAKLFNKTEEEAIICAHLVSTYFHLKKYDEALSYATHCRELSKYFSDPAVFVRAINIESATYRQLASKQDNDQTKQLNYQRAIEIAFEAKSMYSEKNLNNPKLEGRIHFNLGEICKNNPKSNIEEAIHYYLHANSCFEKVEETRNLLIQT